jgi:competence protein ComEC
MALLGTVSLSLRRSYSAPRALFIAGYVMVFENPNILLHDPSFQLSFLATLGLIVFAERIENMISFVTDKFGIRGLVATTFATQIAVAPFILYTMGTISVIGFLVNIFVLPLVPITMLFVTLTGLVGFISSSVSTILGWISYILLEYELAIVDFASKIPMASLEIGKFSVLIVIGIYLTYSVYMVYIYYRHRKTTGVI